MKSHDYKPFAPQKSLLIPLAVSLAGLSAMPAMAQVNSVIFATAPAGVGCHDWARRAREAWFLHGGSQQVREQLCGFARHR